MITPILLAYLSHHFQLNFKALGEWLEECRIIHTGSTMRVQESRYVDENGKSQRFKVSYVLERAEKWHLENGKAWDIWETA